MNHTPNKWETWCEISPIELRLTTAKRYLFPCLCHANRSGLKWYLTCDLRQGGCGLFVWSTVHIIFEEGDHDDASILGLFENMNVKKKFQTTTRIHTVIPPQETATFLQQPSRKDKTLLIFPEVFYVQKSRKLPPTKPTSDGQTKRQLHTKCIGRIRLTTLRRTSSLTFLALWQTSQAEECEKMTGASVAFRTACMVS